MSSTQQNSGNRFCDIISTKADNHAHNEKKTRLVIILTVIMMVAEIAGGIAFNSMALLADGWHMATHAGALGIAAFAYYYARKHVHDARFTFGTGKVTTLGGFASAIVLGIVSLMIGFESFVRLMNPLEIDFTEAMIVAVIGLAVNIASAFLLHDNGHHHHGDHHGHSHHDCGHHHNHSHQHHDHNHHHGTEDLNLKAAYMHVIADALTSVLAILALIFGQYLGWIWLDAAVGVLGAFMIARWAYQLIGQTSHVLLDRLPDESLYDLITKTISQNEGDQITDLHIWAIAPGRYSMIMGITTKTAITAAEYKKKLADLSVFEHITVEITRA